MNGESDERIAATVVHRSLIRPDRDHLAGAERSLIVWLAAIVFILVWLTPSVLTWVVGAALIVVGVPALREMAKRDPIFSRVLTRRLQQQREYQAHAYVGAPLVERNAQQRD